MERFCWEDNTSEDTLKNGFNLYRRGYIKSPKKNGNSYSFKIGSYYSFETIIDYNAPGDFSYTCGCFEFRSKRQMCEHIVGALYRIENAERQRRNSGKMVMPFHRNVLDNDYHFFDICSITENVVVHESQLETARKMIADGRLTARGFSVSKSNGFYDNKNEKQINSVCECGDNRKYRIYFDFTSKGIKSFRCTMPRCYFEYNGSFNSRDVVVPCEHCIGAMLLAKEYIDKNNPGDITDESALKLMKHFRKRSGESDVKRADIVLEPELANDDGELLVSFKIGDGKLYKVKNLTTLVETVQTGGVLALGKTASIDFSLSTFDEKSVWYYEFIQTRVKDNEQRNARLQARNRWGYYYAAPAIEKITGSINLEGSGIEEIYEYFRSNNIRIPYVRKMHGKSAGKGVLMCRDGCPEVLLKVKELRDGRNTAGINVSGHVPEFCQGSVSAYFSDDRYLYRIPDAEYKKLWPILELANDDGDINLTIGRRNLGEFYHSVLPALSEFATIEDDAVEKIADILPPKAEITFYLDSQDGIPECRIKAVYDGKEHSALESIGAEMYSETYRDFFHENEAAEAAGQFFNVYDRENDMLYCSDESEIFRIYREGLDAFLAIGDVQCTDRFQNRRIRSVSGIKVGVSIESDLLNLDISSGDISKEELVEILASFRMKRKYHRLTNGDFLDLEDDGIKAVAALLDSGNVSPKELLGDKITIPMYRALYVDKLLEKNEELYGHRDRNFRKLIKDFGTVRDSDIEVPASLENTLRGYQVYGYKWLRTLEQNGLGGILADEMGLGKTLQVITMLEAVAEEKRKAVSLIVCPASLVFNWKEEFARFAPKLTVEAVADGAEERRLQIKKYKSADVLVTSYDLLKRDIAEYEECRFDFCIIDEAQYIKNPRTAASKTVKAINAARRFALTGTPIENRLSELWSIFDFLMPGFLYDYETFRQTLESPIAKDKDEEASERLRRMVHPFILRRLKSDVLKDLPDKIEEVHYAIMEKEQQKLYDAQVLKISNKLKGETEEQFRSSKIEILAELTRTRQLCCDPGLVYENYSGESAKRAAAIELIGSAIEGEHRILVFSQFTSMLDLLAADLRALNIPFYILTGDTGKEERVKLMKDFNEGDVPVFLISLKAGGTGLNLTGADIVIHYDPWWNIAVQNQATDRAHRIGQTKMVTVYKLIIKGTIEEKIVKLQESKKDLADGILSGEMGGIGSLSREDLLELL